MGLFRNEHVPHEPSAAERIGPGIPREHVVKAFDRLALWAHRRGNHELVDLILDERLIVRPLPEVPVIPGRAS